MNVARSQLHCSFKEASHASYWNAPMLISMRSAVAREWTVWESDRVADTILCDCFKRDVCLWYDFLAELCHTTLPCFKQGSRSALKSHTNRCCKAMLVAYNWLCWVFHWPSLRRDLSQWRAKISRIRDIQMLSQDISTSRYYVKHCYLLPVSSILNYRPWTTTIMNDCHLRKLLRISCLHWALRFQFCSNFESNFWQEHATV